MSLQTCRCIAAAFAALLVSEAHSAIHFVSVNLAGGGNTGTSWADAFRGPLSLQNALGTAQAGDQIWVVAGTYTPGPPGDITATFQLAAGVEVYGGFIGNEILCDQRRPDLNPTILSGDVGHDDVYGSPVWYIGWNINTPNSEHVVTSSGVDATAMLDGFTITAGRSGYGGGISNIAGSPSVINCTFFRNLAAFGSGGAIYSQDGSLTLSRCTFLQNWVHLGQGGALFNTGSGTITINDCTFIENRCTGDTEAAGGAISNYPGINLIIDRCTFQQNIAQSFYPSGGYGGGYGGAIHHLGAALAIKNSIFTSNFSNAGGAIWTWRDSFIINCVFRSNEAPEYQAQQGGWGGVGGAIACSAFSPITVSVINCTIVSNTSKACGGFRAMSNVTGEIHNSILWNNSDEHGSIGPSQIRGNGATYCDIQNMLVGIPGEDPPDPKKFPNCFDLNPQFVNLNLGDLHLASASPCIDTGLNALVPADVQVDLDGRARMVDGDSNGTIIVDLGAFEWPIPCPIDITGDGAISVNDLLAVINGWGKCPSPPAACPADISPPGGNGIVNVNDLLTVINNWGPCF